MGINKKSLAKVFGPAVLLTAALVLPSENLAAAAPAPGFAAVQLDKGDQRRQKNQQRVNRGQARKQQVQAQREQARKQQVRVQRQQARQQRVAAQQAQARQQRIAAQQQRQQRIAAQQQAQIRQQRIENQRLARIRQQQIAAQRQAEIRRQRDLQIARERAAARRYNDRYAYDNRYYDGRNVNRGRGGADRSVIAADGYLEDTGRCLILRGHQGQVYNLVGGTEGLREGEHVRLVGRLLYDRDGCGEAMDVHQVQAIWADRNHRQTYFDHQRDGSFRNSYRERYSDRYYDEYEDDYRYDDYYYDPPR